MFMVVLRVDSMYMFKIEIIIEDKCCWFYMYIFMVVLHVDSVFVFKMFVIVNKYVHGWFCKYCFVR